MCKTNLVLWIRGNKVVGDGDDCKLQDAKNLLCEWIMEKELQIIKDEGVTLLVKITISK